MSAAERLDALARAVRAGRDVLDDDVVARVGQVEEKAGHRLRLSPDHTVVAVAGATGSGKSSLVNALVGTDVAEVDVLRPTTSEALAVVRGQDGATALTDWLGVRRRHVLDDTAGTPDVRGRGGDGGLVLLDLPDHDSVVTDHRVEAERLLELVDLMVWVVDPQKYADAALHERYLRALTSHRDVLLLVLNHADRLRPDERAAAVADLERLLALDGLADVPVLVASARTGEGVDLLRDALDDAARRREAATARVLADVHAIAERIAAACTGAPARRTVATDDLVDALARVAGVPTVTEAVRDAWRLRGRRATGWPVTRWVARARPDPLRRLHLGRRTAERDADPDVEVSRTSLRTGPAEHARARRAVRDHVDTATAGLPDRWVLAARAAVDEDLADDLDRAVAAVPLVPDRAPAWWRAVGAVQWFLLAVAVAGALWLAGLALLAYLQVPAPPTPRWGDVPWPTVGLVGGAALGVLVALLARAGVAVGARRRARRASARLRAAVRDVAERRVVAPVDDVVARLVECRTAAEQAMGGRARETGPR